MGALYWIGLALGLGVSAGVLFAGILATGRGGIGAAVVLAVAAGATLGLVISGIEEAVAGGLGGLAGSVGSAGVVRGALRRGGVRGATSVLVGLVALVCALLALIPFAGYVEAIVLPALGLRLRRSEGDRYAGLRILARD